MPVDGAGPKSVVHAGRRRNQEWQSCSSMSSCLRGRGGKEGALEGEDALQEPPHLTPAAGDVGALGSGIRERAGIRVLCALFSHGE